MWGPSPRMPDLNVEEIWLNIDNDAATPMTRFNGDLKTLDFLRYDVTSVAAQLRSGGTAAIIGVGGRRDVLNCAAQGFTRIVGIEVNSAMVDLTSKRFEWFSGFTKIPGFELHNDEGRSYLTRSGERFDLIQTSLVDTWAATSAGAMALSENALYTVDGWKVFYEHLKPGGAITFSRWFYGAESAQTFRLYAVARAMLMAEGVGNPEAHLALIKSGLAATLLASNQPFSPRDIQKLKSIIGDMSFTPVVIPGEPILEPELQRIVATRSLEQLAALRQGSDVDYSPTFDSSPYFFNAVHIRNIVKLATSGGHGANLRAMLFLPGFMVAALILVVTTIVLPARLLNSRTDGAPKPLYGAVAYFIAIGLGFILVEMAMMQQLSIFLGHPIYSMVVVLGGLILSAGVGSLASDRWQLKELAESGPSTGCRSFGGRILSCSASGDACVYGGFAVAESPDLSGSGFSVWLSAWILLPCRDAMAECSVAGPQSAMDVGIERRSRNTGEFHRHPDLDGLEHRVLRIDGRGMLSARRTRDVGQGQLSHGKRPCPAVRKIDRMQSQVKEIRLAEEEGFEPPRAFRL